MTSQELLSPRELRQKVSRVKQPLAEHRLTVQLSGKNNNKKFIIIMIMLKILIV